MMASFLKIALPLAERGFRVFPLIPQTTRPVDMAAKYDHFDAAKLKLHFENTLRKMTR